MRRIFSSLGASFDRLSSREQRMVLVAVAAIAGFVAVLGVVVVRADMKKREARIAYKVERLGEVLGLRQDYERRLAEQNRLAADIRKNNSMGLLAYIEEVGTHANVPLTNAHERSGESLGSDLLREEAAEITIKNISISRLYEFLKKIEEGNHLVRIRHLKVTRRFDNPKKLDAVVTIGTFKTASAS